ncbi:hypothetical protein AKJ63_00585 [candidate division MSBL1 archaeon SCGC-AAA259D18]|uniref:Class II aldolase/adducin N-terminal domain-containing protein n=2 Tax=candidate division MSBL1 TaxID=215777 RepID=A0A133U9R3_9EURY|nr:hypothetical protein AKJ57_03165 [candidate division MSBL1 archaeon SCGC-AAA259A05]KXA91866.1 hypothetical protein AKJ63_00585 [candidate division MSBL1 archaeon SCGC-AAA259D18]
MTRAKKEITQAGTKIYDRGLVAGTWGNISKRLEEDPKKFAITPSGMDYRKIKEEDIVILNLEGEKKEGERIPSAETPLHAHVYKTREEINAVIHTHSVYASAIACLRENIPPIVEDMVQIVGGGIETAEYELPGTEELAESALRALNHKKAALLANHGVISLGKDVDEAIKVAEIVEKSAKIYLLAEFLGNPKKLDEEEVEKMKEAYRKYGQS